MTDPEIYVMPPMHPGEMLREEYLGPLGVDAVGLAKASGVPRARIDRILRGEAGIGTETALRLGKVLGTGAEFWLVLQARYDIQHMQAQIGPALAALAPLVQAH